MAYRVSGLEDSTLSETNGEAAASEQTACNLWEVEDGWTSVGILAGEERIEFYRGKQGGWLRRLILREVGERTTSTSYLMDKQGERTGTLESRTRTSWPTVKAHGGIHR